jgi:outer membrane protein TolC
LIFSNTATTGGRWRCCSRYINQDYGQAQIDSQIQGIEVLNGLVSSVTGLRAKGLISELQYRKRELAALEQKQKLNSLKQQLADRQNQFTDLVGGPKS